MAFRPLLAINILLFLIVSFVRPYLAERHFAAVQENERTLQATNADQCSTTSPNISTSKRKAHKHDPNFSTPARIDGLAGGQ